MMKVVKQQKAEVEKVRGLRWDEAVSLKGGY
jgi:hypothetical protein